MGVSTPRTALLPEGPFAAPPARDAGSGALPAWAQRTAWAVLIACCAIAAITDGLWPVRAASLLFWLGGFWRQLLVPLTATTCLVLAIANGLTPGSVWPLSRRVARRTLFALPIPLALALGAFTFLLTTGALTFAHVARSLAIFGLQVALVPETPPALALLLAAGAILAIDARGRSAVLLLLNTGRTLQPIVAGWLRALAPAVATMLVASIVAAWVFPLAMRGWARAETSDSQSYDLYRSFFNYSGAEDPQIEQRTGFGLGLRGLTLPPGGQGTVVFRLNRPPESVVLLKPDFYNRPLDASGAALTTETFPNSFEVAAGQDAPYRVALQNVSIGEILGSQVLDITSLLSNSRIYRLRFSATNTSAVEVTVLPSVVISTVTDQETVPHPTFPVVAYAAASAGALYVLARCVLSWRHAALIGASSGTLVVLAARIAMLMAPAGTIASPVGTTGVLAGLLYNPAPPLADSYAVRGALVATVGLILAGLVLTAFSLRFWRRSSASEDGAYLAAASVAVDRLGASSTAHWSRAWLVAACLIVAAVATEARWAELVRVRYEFLLPDALGYKAIANEFPARMEHYRVGRHSQLLEDAFGSGYDGRASALAIFFAAENNGREPGWPGLLRLVFNVLGVSAFHTRLTSLGLSVAIAALTCWLGWRTLHPLVGVTGGLLFALNPAQVANSVGGLREELVSAYFLILVAALFVGARPRRVSWQRLLIVGAASGGLVLVRADMLVLAGLVITLAALALRWHWRMWLVACVLMGGLASPMYLGFGFTRLDPFHPGTYGSTVNRNLEFPERMGTPGFPTAEEYAANWAAGPSISPFKYFFGYHTIPQFIEYSIRGFIRVFPTILFRDQPIVLWLCVAGAALLLLRRRWLIPFAIFIGLAPFYAFMAGVPNPWVFAPRYAHHVLPYAVLAAAFGVWCLPLWIAQRARGRAQTAYAAASSV